MMGGMDHSEDVVERRLAQAKDSLFVGLISAAQVAGVDVLPLPIESGYQGVHVRGLDDGQEVWVVQMLFNYRVMETHWPSAGPGRWWCYAGADLDAFLRAVIHASLYGDGEPDGWVRSWDGRRG